MPFKYNRKTNRGSWPLEDMTRAINAVQTKSMGIRKASRTYHVPYGTLQDRLKGKVDGNNKKLGRHAVLKPVQEEELCNHIIKMSKLFYGLSRLQVKKIAFQYAEANNIPNNFNKVKKICGNDWYYGFLKRHPNISLRKPESTSLNRVKGFNKQEVDLFFSNLSRVFKDYNYPANRIYNADETGITPVHIPAKILAGKGQRQVGAITSGERGKLVTVLCSVSAAGDYVPPMFIFGRGRMKYELTKNGPTNAVYRVSKNGWINEDLFFEWIEHFARHTKCSIMDKVLLIIDNHSSHCTLKVYNFCKENGITIVTLPPHTSHRLQPLDVCVYGPLKTAYNRECDSFLRSKNYQKIDQSDIAELFKKAYNKIATIEKGVKGFEATGIFPINRDVINEEEFIIIEESVAEGEESQKQYDDKDKRNKTKKGVETKDKTANMKKIIIDPSIANISSKDLAEAGSSGISKQKTTELDTDSESDTSIVYYTDVDSDNDLEKSVSANVSFEDLQAIPRFLRSSKEKGKKTHSQLFTVTPNKIELEMKENTKVRKMELAKSKGTKRKLVTDDKLKKAKPNSQKKNLEEATDSCSMKEKPNSLNQKLEEATDPCIVCTEFGKDNEWWVTCPCGKSSHAECAGVEITQLYICHFCQP